ncbi:MAG TPA: thioredoxin family protein [Candidatus Hydrogenedentes bacterium]|nr:thioredoxin family protein [Candidatus Hydrogenedentota bacterium]HNT87407.1 thioredoxin family protein [Candidatus Hydrogenedentota bacterium]
MRKVHVLGTGCMKCRKLAETAEAAIEALGVPCELEKVTDIEKILDFGVMTTPAIVVDGEVKVAGRVPSLDEMKALLEGEKV